MKFRVTTKDLIIFIIFCFFLLYLSAIAVLNVTSLLNEGTFYGLLPFAAFFPPYLGATFVVFVALIAAIFISVSSYIFDREKGVGFNFGEKEVKGYTRWSKDHEIKNAKEVVKVKILDSETKAGGVPLLNNGKEMWVDNGENHTLVIGATASGKTTAVVDPLVQSLAKAGESMILTDPKGELHRNHSEMLKNKGYNIVVLNFRNPGLGNAWNPLTLPYKLYKVGNTDKATELLDDVALNILRGAKTDDPFWESSAADYFSGLSLGLFEDATEKEIHLNSIGYMSTIGEEKFGTSDYIKEYFLLKGESSSPYVFASNTINAPNETKGGILSVFRQKIRLFTSREQLSEMLSYSDFDIREIGTKKTAVFMIIHDEKTTYHALATIFIKQCYETLIDVAQENGGQLPFRTNFILDEFANMPPLKDVTAMVTAARSRRIRFTFIIQNFAQLNDVYGKNDADTIRSNCGNLIYLITTELAALEEISKLCGEVKSKEKEKTSSTPLISVSDLQKMKLNEVVILKSRLNPYRTKLTPSYEIDWGNNFASGSIPERKLSQIELFNIKDYVKTKKRNKIFESLGNNDRGNDYISKNILNPLFPQTDRIGFEEPKEIIDFKEEEKTPPIITFNPLNEPLDDEDAEAKDITKLPVNNDEDYANIQKQKFNVEDLIKRIDAKILELEKEEKENKNKNQNSGDLEKLDNDNYDKLENTIYEKFDDFMKTNDTEEATEPVIKVDDESVIVDSDNVTDDQFYDDFFTDSER